MNAIIRAMEGSIDEGRCEGPDASWREAPECARVFDADGASMISTPVDNLNIVNTSMASWPPANGSYIPHNLQNGEGFYYESAGALVDVSEEYYHAMSNVMHMLMFNTEFPGDNGNVSRSNLVCARIRTNEDEESSARETSVVVVYTAAIATIAAGISYLM